MSSTITEHPDHGRRSVGSVGTGRTVRGTHSWRRTMRTLGRGVLMLVVVLTSIILVAGAVAKARLRAHYPPIGQLVDVGGYQLHVACQGTGSPTVILEAGVGSAGVYWALVQPEIAQTTRVCVYDRAGLGWSDRSPQPRTITVMAAELATLLTNADIRGPYVLVGHSVGGAIIRQFAVAHPAEIVGMVLVDSATEQQVRRFPEPIRAAGGSQQRAGRVLQLAASAGLLALNPTILPFGTGLPPEARATTQALVAASGKVLATFLAEVDQVSQDTTLPLTTLGDLPLVVLRHGRVDLQPSDGVTQADVDQYEAIWVAMQQELAALSPQGRLVVAERSGHDIPLEQPELVIRAIHEVLAPR